MPITSEEKSKLLSIGGEDDGQSTEEDKKKSHSDSLHLLMDDDEEEEEEEEVDDDGSESESEDDTFPLSSPPLNAVDVIRCPVCQAPAFHSEFTRSGIALAMVFFPIGLLFAVLLAEKALSAVRIQGLKALIQPSD
ncbi:hypothetical protein TYRP_006277 [Tyrophagus putrescentiae]|nr:hypothetical protein TYRP_006277 [Tyrophagus putrescentiae]